MKPLKALKAVKDFFFTVLSWVFAVFVALIFGIFVLVYLPVDYVKYRKSRYYRMTLEKYSPFAASGFQFRLFQKISENQLPIRYISNPAEKTPEAGWFLYGDTVILSRDFSYEYFPEEGRWAYFAEDEAGSDTLMTPEEEIGLAIDEVNRLTGTEECKKGVILFDCAEEDYAEEAKQNPLFLTYDKDPTEALRRLCNMEADS